LGSSSVSVTKFYPLLEKLNDTDNSLRYYPVFAGKYLQIQITLTFTDGENLYSLLFNNIITPDLWDRNNQFRETK